jgi:shikimate kinase
LKTKDPKRTFSELFRNREMLYAGAADVSVDTSFLSHGEVVEAILCKMERFMAVEQ